MLIDDLGRRASRVAPTVSMLHGPQASSFPIQQLTALAAWTLKTFSSPPR